MDGTRGGIAKCRKSSADDFVIRRYVVYASASLDADFRIVLCLLFDCVVVPALLGTASSLNIWRSMCSTLISPLRPALSDEVVPSIFPRYFVGVRSDVEEVIPLIASIFSDLPRCKFTAIRRSCRPSSLIKDFPIPMRRIHHSIHSGEVCSTPSISKHSPSFTPEGPLPSPTPPTGLSRAAARR